MSALLGGGQTYLTNLLRALSKQQCNVVVILSSSNFHVFSKFECQNIKLIQIDFASKSILHRVFWEKFVLPHKLKAWGADIYYTPGGIMTTNVPYNCVSITNLQNMLPFELEERRRFPFFSYARFKWFVLRFVFLKSYDLVNKVIFISKYSRDVVTEIRPAIESKSVVIPLAVNDIFCSTVKDFDLPEGIIFEKFYLYVSHPDYYKAQKELVMSWKTLIDSGFDYPLVLVGPTINNYGRELVSLIQELKLESHVIYLGGIEYEKLPQFYQASRALIFASSCECCPNILLEMLASGKTILCSNYGPMPEFGEDGVIYFDPYSSDQLVEAVNEIESGVIENKVMAKRAYKLSAKYRHAQLFEKIIKYLLS